MTKLRILLTNYMLGQRTGSELYVYEVSKELRRRGHSSFVYSPQLGPLAAELRNQGIPVVDDLAKIAEAPDLIHGHHHLTTMTALHHFPQTPAIHFCHGWTPWEEAPPLFPRIVQYVSVSKLTRERLVFEHGIAPENVSILGNFVDTSRFCSLAHPATRPKKALVYSNQADEGNILPIIREACKHREIILDSAGRSCGNPISEPEKVLPQYDIVFARGRSALEAMAVGCAVILCDIEGLGPLVTTADLETLQAANWGLAVMSSPLTAEAILHQLDRYNAEESAAVSAAIRAAASLDTALGALIEVYHDAIRKWRSGAYNLDESGSTASYLRWLSKSIYSEIIQSRDELISSKSKELAYEKELSRQSNAEQEKISRQNSLLAKEAEQLRLEKAQLLTELNETRMYAAQAEALARRCSQILARRSVKAVIKLTNLLRSPESKLVSVDESKSPW